MCFYILTFRTHPTFIWTGYWVALAHWPVVVDYIFIHRAIVLAVLTVERTPGAGLSLMSMHMATLEVLATVRTCNCCKRATNQLLAKFWVQIQVFLQFSQLPCPLTATLLMGAPNLKGVQRPSQSFIRKHAEIRFITRRTCFFVILDALNTGLAEAVTTTGRLTGVAKNQQTDGTVYLQLLRALDEFAIVTTSISRGRLDLSLFLLDLTAWERVFV